jgi:site-specific recombinase XerD
MATKVNLKKYLPLNGKWQFAPVVKVNGRPDPKRVLIGGKAVGGTTGTFYLEWRESGKRIQKPVGSSPREALDAWRDKVARLVEGDDIPEESSLAPSVSKGSGSIETAFATFLTQVEATKSPGTLDAYRADLDWCAQSLKALDLQTVRGVTHARVMDMLSLGRKQGLAQSSINRRVMVCLMALRKAGSSVRMGPREWPSVAETEIDIYQRDEIETFLKACDLREGLIFRTFLLTGFRAREVATLTWDSIDWNRNTLSVKARPAYKFVPKSYEAREVPVPAAFIEQLRVCRKQVKGDLVFPTPPHPKRSSYGGDKPDAHHLELCKAVALRAGLNCGNCSVTSTTTVRQKTGSQLPKKYRTRTKRCSVDASCTRWYLHKWRHTFATNLLQSNVDIRSLQTLLGHQNLATTEKYVKALRIDDLSSRIEASLLTRYV